MALYPADGARTHLLLGAQGTRVVTFPRQQTAFLKAPPLTTIPWLPIVNLASEGKAEHREQNNLTIRLAGAAQKSEDKTSLIRLFVTLHQYLLGGHIFSYRTNQYRRVHYYGWENEIQREKVASKGRLVGPWALLLVATPFWGGAI